MLSSKQKKKLISAIIAIVALFIGGIIQTNNGLSESNSISANSPGFYKVVEFSDGDTIKIDMAGKTETVRFIGVDTPETHDPRKAVQCYGVKASEFTRNLIGDNRVRLESDPQNTNRDRYNRLLRYVFLPDGTLVNAEIIKQGYGFAYTSFPFSKLDEFRDFQNVASSQNIGLWSACSPTQNDYGGYTSNDSV